MHGIYLHGFASGPLTAKGNALGARLGGAMASWTIPDLEGGDFATLTMDAWLRRAEAAVAGLPDDGRPVLLVGSSLGGWGAATLAARGLPRVAAALLIAPAFGFTERWADRLGPDAIARWRRDGALPFFHYGQQREIPLGVGFLDSCAALAGWPPAPTCRCAVVHGRQDETIPAQASQEWARRHDRVELHLVNGDHRLTEPRHEALIEHLARDLMTSAPA
jgi:pimeloyl-ACP methyl ester carboxylesterase